MIVDNDNDASHDDRLRFDLIIKMIMITITIAIRLMIMPVMTIMMRAS